MDIDPKLFSQLLETFQTELDEQLQVITQGLLALENSNSPDEHNKIMQNIFRAAHTIKGAGRSLGISEVGEIAHRVESLFSSIQKNNRDVTTDLINLILEAVDKMKIAMQSFLNKTKLPFDLSDFLKKLEQDSSAVSHEKKTEEIPSIKPETPDIKVSHESIHVSIKQLDRISVLMEEMQVNELAIDDYFAEVNKINSGLVQFSQLWKKIIALQNHPVISQDKILQNIFSTSNDYFSEIFLSSNQLKQSMRSRMNELKITFNTLQEELRLLRLVPVSNLLSNLPRYLRDISHELHKPVELKIIGEEVQIDKMILENLSNPIIHIIRNAIDHGIESAEIRKKNGKPEIGHITINIESNANQVNFIISDDGAGIDIEKVAQIAIKNKLVNESEIDKMDQQSILELIFLPGFSTKEIITELSGRGVGLDVVKTSLLSIKGRVNIQSILGKGTIFTLSVPLTLTGERGLMVNAHDQLFIIPISAITRVLTIPSTDIVNVEGLQAIIIDEQPIPLRSLGALLDFGEKSNKSYLNDQLFIIVIFKDNNKVALLVDEIIGEREIILKPLQAIYNNLPTIMGGALFGNNQVMLVLNPGELINKALQITKAIPINFEKDKVIEIERPHILVVDDSITTRTLEKNILESKNYQVSVAANGKEAWEMIQKQKFSLLITDINMPIMDGFTLTKNVKSDDKTRDLPVIIVTSLGSDEEKKYGIDAGADAYIVKNEFESGILLDIVSQLV